MALNKAIKTILKNPHKLGHFLGFHLLSEIHSYWIKQYWLSKNDYVLQAHRNSYKTTACIIIGYIWFSLQYPDIPVLLIREESKNAERSVRTISNILKSEKMRYLYEQIYGIQEFMLVKDNVDSIVLPTKQRVTIEGSLDCIGIGVSITGRHYPKIIADDIITIKDRVSAAYREQKKLFIQELENIKTVNGQMSISGTPWHRQDGFTLLPDAEKFPIRSIEIKGFDETKIQQIKSKMTSSLFAANYELKHAADKDLMFDDIKFDKWYWKGAVKAHIDPAYSGENTTALTMLNQYQDQILIKGWIFDESIIDCIDKICRLLHEYNCISCIVENNKDEGYTVKEIRKQFQNCNGYRESMNKHYKIQQYLKANWENVFFADDCQPEYLAQVQDYEEGEKPDDAPDSLSSIIREEREKSLDDFESAIIIKDYNQGYIV